MKRVRIKPEQVEAWVSKNFSYKKRSSGRQLSINNPFDGDTGSNLWISLEETTTKRSKYRTYYVHDWRHDRDSCSFISFIRKYRNCSFYQAISEVCQEDLGTIKYSFYKKPVEEEIVKQIELPKSSKLFSGELSIAGELALRFLKSRMISLEQAKKFGLYYTCTTVVFPYYEFEAIEYWQERELLSKRFNFPNENKFGVSKTDFLYNFDNVECPEGTVILVESIIDAINIGDDCLAIGGSTISKDSKQVTKLRMLNPKMIILAPDNDVAGRNSLVSNFLALRPLSCRIGYCLPPEKDGDWNDVECGGWGSARRHVVNNSRELSLARALRLRS